MTGKKTKTIKWMAWEEVGSPIYRMPDDGNKPQDEEGWKAYMQDEASLFLEVGDLKVGSMFLATGIFGELLRGTVEEMKTELIGISPSGNRAYILEYDANRPVGPSCWKCTGMANLKGLRKLELYKEDNE